MSLLSIFSAVAIFVDMSLLRLFVTPSSLLSANALYEAAESGALSAVKLLIAKGAPVDRFCRRRGLAPATPLFVAASLGHADVVKLLIAARACVDLPNSHGLTPLHEAAWNGYVDIVKLLLAAGASTATQSAFGTTPLHDAIMSSHITVLETLLRAGADPDVTDSAGNTPLMRSAECGDVQSVSLLLKYRACPRKANNLLETPLHRATTNGHTNIICLLLANGADISHKDGAGLTALDRTHHNARDVALLMICFGASMTARFLSDPRWDAAFINRLLVDGGDVRIGGHDAAHTAANRGSIVAVYLLSDTEGVPRLRNMCRRLIRTLLFNSVVKSHLPLPELIHSLVLPLQLERFLSYDAAVPVRNGQTLTQNE